MGWPAASELYRVGRTGCSLLRVATCTHIFSAMNRLWDPILRDLTEAAQPRCLVEIGVDTGLLTAKLLDYCASADAVLHAIDPRPELDVNEWRAHHGERLLFHRARSLDVLEQIHMVDMVF